MKFMANAWVLAVMHVAALGLMACQKSVTVNGQDVGAGKNLLPSPTAVVQTAGGIVLQDGLGSDRTYYQTRSVINLQLGNDAIKPGDVFSLTDIQSGARIVDQQSVGASLALTGAVSLEMRSREGSEGTAVGNDSGSASSYELILKIYPGATDSAGKLIYGGNDLQLLVDGATQVESVHHIELHDFSVMAVEATHFTSNVASSGGLQGEISSSYNPVVSNGVQTLTTGLLSSLNR